MKRLLPTVLLLACSPDEGGLASDVGPDVFRPPAIDGAPPPALDMRVDPPPRPDMALPPPPDGAIPPDAALPPPADAADPPDAADMGLPPPIPQDGGAGDADPTRPPPDGDCGSPQETTIANLVNMTRQAAGLAAVACDSRVANGARAHSTFMCQEMSFQFDGPNGEDALDRVRAAGTNADTYGAAISRGRSDAQRTFDSWSDNEGIAETFVGEEYGRIGVGYVPCDDRHYWTLYLVD